MSLLRIILLLFVVIFCSNAHAHLMGQSYIFLTVQEKAIDGRVEITLADLNRVLSLNLPEDGNGTMQQILLQKESINNYVKNRVGFAIGAETVDFTITDHGILNTPFAQFARIYFELPPSFTPIDALSITNELVFHHDSVHRSLLVIENHWKTGLFDNEMVIALTFSPNEKTQDLDLTKGSLLTGFWAFIKLGMHHIWIGADHVLFLIALLLPGVVYRADGRWTGVEELKTAIWHIIKIVTVFTIAHSITLSLAALELVVLPSRFVESIIAISIAGAALYILWPGVKLHAYWVVLIFGLFHGFGFASILADMQIPDRYIVWSLFGFNLGVEIGQVVIVLVLLPVLFVVRNSVYYTRFVLPLGALGLIAVSIYWFIERAFDMDFRVGSALKSMIGI